MEEVYEIAKDFLGKKREDYLPEEAKYMLLALSSSFSSKDPSTQVGVCFVNEEGKVLSVGCNNNPANWSDIEFPWGNNTKLGEKNTKYPYVIHAEMNGITNYNGSINDFKNSTAYVTLFPCTNCSKLMIQFGVKKIVYLVDDRKESVDNITSKILLKKCNVEYIDFNETNNITFDIDSKNNIVKRYINN